MLRAILIITLLLFSDLVVASTTAYWVVGSFASASNAEAVEQAVESRLNIPITIVRSNDGRYYRLLIESAIIEQSVLTEAGVPSWQLVLDNPGEQAVLPEAVTVPAETDPAPVLITAPETEEDTTPLFPDLGSDEPLADYCQRLPDETLCQHPMIQWALRNETRVQAGKAALEQTCRNTRRSEALAICDEWRSEKQE